MFIYDVIRCSVDTLGCNFGGVNGSFSISTNQIETCDITKTHKKSFLDCKCSVE